MSSTNITAVSNPTYAIGAYSIPVEKQETASDERAYSVYAGEDGNEDGSNGTRDRGFDSRQDEGATNTAQLSQPMSNACDEHEPKATPDTSYYV